MHQNPHHIGRNNLRGDFFGGLTAAVIALPIALGGGGPRPPPFLGGWPPELARRPALLVGTIHRSGHRLFLAAHPALHFSAAHRGETVVFTAVLANSATKPTARPGLGDRLQPW